jgi:hypothetical protein
MCISIRRWPYAHMRLCRHYTPTKPSMIFWSIHTGVSPFFSDALIPFFYWPKRSWTVDRSDQGVTHFTTRVPTKVPTI